MDILRIAFKNSAEEALKKSLENTQKKLDQKSREAFSPMRYDREDYMPPAPIRKPFRGYDWVGSDDYDDGSVVVDVSRYSGASVISEPRFKMISDDPVARHSI